MKRDVEAKVLKELRAYQRLLKKVWFNENVSAVELNNRMNRVSDVLKEATPNEGGDS